MKLSCLPVSFFAAIGSGETSLAEWLAFASGAIYLPFEIIELMATPSLLHVSILVVNLAVVLYMLYLRTWGRSRDARKDRDAYDRNVYEAGG